MGPLTEPKFPDVPGLDDFAGKVMHSARWDHDYDLTGKRVASIGTGASAIQYVPEIQPDVEQLLRLPAHRAWVCPARQPADHATASAGSTGGSRWPRGSSAVRSTPARSAGGRLRQEARR